MRTLAVSDRNKKFFALPSDILGNSPVQRLSNQRTNRHLSRNTGVPSVTPIWQQPIFTPSESMQRMFLQQKGLDIVPLENTPEKETPHMSVTDEVKSTTAPLPVTQQTPIQKTPQTTTNTEATVMTPPSQNPSSSMALSQSLDAVTHIKQQIMQQEQKLKELQIQSPDLARQQEEVASEQKTKQAILKNLEHALQNTQNDLASLENKPGTNPTIVQTLKTQLKQQKDQFTRLSHEYSMLNKKQEAIQEKQTEHTRAQTTLDQLQKQHEQLVPPVTTQTPLPTAVQPPTAKPLATTKTSAPTPSPPVVSRPATPAKIIMPAITKQPNAINGIVQSAQGKLITNAVVIIKTSDQRPLRALKTNELGQFWITTALENGTYVIQTEKDAMRFDTIEVQLTGGIVEPVIIKETSV